jgi:DNA modification methylase
VIHYQAEDVTVHHGDCIEVMRTMPDNSVDAIVTDPPYGLEFMGKDWDSFKPAGSKIRTRIDGRTNGATKSTVSVPEQYSAGEPFQHWCQAWATEARRVLKPGGHMLAFGGTRTWHRLAVAIEDAGFEMRDSIAWLYGSGFPKSLDVSKAIDKAAGAEREIVGKSASHGLALKPGRSTYVGEFLGERPDAPDITAPATDAARQWQGWGTALKPAFEPIVVARKPLQGTVAANVQRWGTGALNIASTRIGADVMRESRMSQSPGGVLNANGRDVVNGNWIQRPNDNPAEHAGRWPANVVLDEFSAAALDQQSGTSSGRPARGALDGTGSGSGKVASGVPFVPGIATTGYLDTGGASRFFYTAKATAEERPKVNGIAHPTCKPLDLMRWLVRLVTPPGGTVLDPFAGSGTTLEAALREGFRCVGIEREAEYLPLIVERVSRPINYTLDVFNGVSDEPEPAAAGDPWVDLALFEEDL